MAKAQAVRLPRGSSADLRSFLGRRPGGQGYGPKSASAALQAMQASAKAADALQAAAVRARTAATAAVADLEAFRQKTEARVLQRLSAKVHDGPRLTRPRLAIVGAGPVGLWLAFLLAQKYRCVEGGPRCPDAPKVVVFEARPEDSHCSRTDIRIALSSSTQSMLNHRTGTRIFASGMPVADIEGALLSSWRGIAPKAKIHFGKSISSPQQLLEENFDVVLWAAGRRSLPAEQRTALGCEVRTGLSEQVLVLQVGDLQGGDAWQLAGADLTGPVRAASRCNSLRVMLRPGVGGACACWIWLFGLPPDPEAAGLSAGQAASGTKDGVCAALEEILGNTGSAVAAILRSACEVLQQRVRAKDVSGRWVDAAFWSSDASVCPLGSRPLILLGDAALGKPFYTGTTLNRHLWEVAAMVDEVDWTADGAELGFARFLPHEKRYQAELRRIAEFHRRSENSAALPPLVAKKRIELQDVKDSLKTDPMPILCQSSLALMARTATHPAVSLCSRANIILQPLSTH